MDAKKIAENAFGVEEEITMDVEDPIVRYYQWLRAYFGLTPRYNVHKCPFYQFLTWGSLFMISLFPLVVAAVIFEKLILNPIGYFWPRCKENFYASKENIGTIPMSTIIVTIITGLLMLLFTNGLWYTGFAIFIIFSAPAYIVYYIGYALIYFIMTIIPFIWSVLVSITWSAVIIPFAMGMGILLGACVVFYLLYKIFSIIFKSKAFKVFIDKSCKIRDRMLKKYKEKRKATKRKIVERKKPVAEKYVKPKIKIKLDWLVKAVEYIFRPIILLVAAILFVFGTIGKFISIAFRIVTQTVSNHCPKMVFTSSYSGIFEVNKYGSYIEIKRTEYDDRFGVDQAIDNRLLPKNFKVKKKSGLVRMNCTVQHNDEHYLGATLEIIKINNIKYLTKAETNNFLKNR